MRTYLFYFVMFYKVVVLSSHCVVDVVFGFNALLGWPQPNGFLGLIRLPIRATFAHISGKMSKLFPARHGQTGERQFFDNKKACELPIGTKRNLGN